MNTVNTVNKSPSITSIAKKLFSTTKRAVGLSISVLDVGVDIVGDTIELSLKTVQAVPVCVKQVTQLPTYTRAQMLVNADETKELTYQAAVEQVRENAWKNPEDFFNSVGRVSGNVISGTVKAFNEE